MPLTRSLRSWRAAGLCAVVAMFTCSVVAQPLPLDLPLRRGTESGGDGGFWMTGVLLVALAIGALAYLGWRRRWIANGRAVGRRVEHALTRISSHALTPQASVHVVQWNGDEYLVGCTSQQVTLLARRTVGASVEGSLP